MLLAHHCRNQQEHHHHEPQHRLITRSTTAVFSTPQGAPQNTPQHKVKKIVKFLELPPGHVSFHPPKGKIYFEDEEDEDNIVGVVERSVEIGDINLVLQGPFGHGSSPVSGFGQSSLYRADVGIGGGGGGFDIYGFFTRPGVRKEHDDSPIPYFTLVGLLKAWYRVRHQQSCCIIWARGPCCKSPEEQASLWRL
jgi:hypothetical protein